MEKLFKNRILLSFLLLGMFLSSFGGHAVAKATLNTRSEVEQYAEKLGERLARESKPVGVDLKHDLVSKDEPVRIIVELKTRPSHGNIAQSGFNTLAKIQQEQHVFMNQIEQSGIEYDLVYSFQKLFNGLSLTIDPDRLVEIEAMAGVQKVFKAMIFERPKPFMKDSAGKVVAPYAWNLGYEGQGMVVAIIDSGFDPSHPDFKLTDSKLAKLTRSKVEAKSLKGSYINLKFPYGWNYYDKTKELYEAGMSHGQHVAGSVAANGQIKGIAPEAQLLAMRVFSNDGSITTTSEDIYLKAMEDAMVLGADALNMSFGAPVGFVYDYDHPIQQAIANANALGAVVAIAAGNDRNLVYGRASSAAFWMPDQGQMNAPAVETHSLAVAAAETIDGDIPSMAWFSSWGSTNDLGLKPEITAPGSSIESTQNDGEYGWMSGTSMATPHVAGGISLIKQYITKTTVYCPEAKKDLAGLTKNLLMNSAQLIYENGVAVSPRVQGAGMMNLEQAIKARTLAVSKETGVAKIELNELSQPKLSLKMMVTNHGSLIRDYKVSAILLTDQIDDSGYYTESSRNVSFTLTGNELFSLEGEASQEISLTLDFSKGKVPKNQFIEGFVIIEDQKGAKTKLPFMGFYGNWSEPEMLDHFMPGEDGTDDPLEKSFFNTSALYGYASDYDEFYQLPNKRLELNPGTSISKVTGKGSIYPVLSVLRNLEILEFNLLSERGEPLEFLGKYWEIFKMGRTYDSEVTAFSYDQGMWDVMFGSKLIPEGNYFYEIKGLLNTKKHQSQTKRIPLLIDCTGPTIKDMWLEGNKLYVKVQDGEADSSVGVDKVIVASGINGTPIEIKLKSSDSETFSGDIDKIIKSGTANLYVFAYDQLLNATSRTVTMDDLRDRVTRIAGSTRYNTALAISSYILQNANTVIIASGVAPADSMLAGPLSAQLKAPVLLVDSKGLSKELISELKRLKATEAIVIGGEGVIPNSLVNELKKNKLTVSRLGGANRYETSILVDRKIRQISGVTDSAVLVNGQSLVDALAMGPVAGRLGVGILFNDGKSIGKVKIALSGRQTVLLLGGTLVQNENVEKEIKQLGLKMERISGPNRRGTAVAVAQRFYQMPTLVVIANEQYPHDALAGAILSFTMDAPMLLNPKEAIAEEIISYMATNKVRSGFILGGTLRISDKVEQDLENILK